ncbi:MAG: SDR family NAD(P)-dependent oxidoreductase [Proteobacteria bacterium]|nr:SDR family NAD(P)-dependent oxidoreductase [Pseudomonadota bacterium]
MSQLKTFARAKVWVITGAAAGIGLELTKILCESGAKVCALDINKANLDELVLQSRRMGWDLMPIEVDVRSELSVSNVINEIKKNHGRIDVWINNAGVQYIAPFSTMSSETFDKVMDINFYSVVRICRNLVHLFEEQGFGSILNMASVAGHVPAPFMASYVASKHGVVGFTKALHAEFEVLETPFRAAFASPGFVDTAIIEKGATFGFPDWLSWMLSDAETCAKQILRDFVRGENEIHPTLSGKMMRAAYNVMPKTTVKSSKILLTKNLKDLVLSRFQVPR